MNLQDRISQILQNPRGYLGGQIHRLLGSSRSSPVILEASPQAESSTKDPVLAPRSDVDLQAEILLRGGYRVKFRTGVKLITILRFLLAKVLYDSEGLHLDEFLALMEAYLLLRDHKDPSFLAKYGQWLITIEPFFGELGQTKVFPIKAQGDTTRIERHLVPFLPSRSAYHGYQGHRELRDSFRLIIRNPLALPKKLPPKRYIGVGYKDKGSRRDPAWDGNPRWQEVAAVSGFTDKPTFETDASDPEFPVDLVKELFTPPAGDKF